MSQKPALTDVDLHELISDRWSPRAFDANRMVEHEDLVTLLEAARWAPSCFNDQPWRFVVCDKGRGQASWSNLLNALAEKNQLWAKNAPVLILICADSQFQSNGKPNRWGQYDSGAAAISLALQATALGLVTHQMGGFDMDAARQALGVPEQFQPMAVMAVGYPGDINALDGVFREAESSPRQRADLNSRFYLSRWDEPVGDA